MNQLDATMIYWFIRSAQRVSGNILPIIRSMRLRYLQHMVSCCCGGQGDGERQRGTICKKFRLRSEFWQNIKGTFEDVAKDRGVICNKT